MTEGKFQTIYTFCFVAKAIILTAAKVPVPTSLGCYQDNPYQSPVLSGLATSATKMTVQGCLAFCRSSEHRYAGVVNRYGCRCGNGFQGDTVVSRRLPDSDCTAPCGGDKSQFCGGPSGSQKIEVFEASIGACGGDLNNDRGTIYSPDFPGPYSPNQNCTWNIQVHSENVVRVTLELSELSPDDVLQIRECGSSQRRVKHLNWSPDTEYISGSNVISIQFRTKPQGEQLRRGFILHYEAVGHCEAISNDAHVGSVSPSLALIGQRVTVTCKDGRAVAVECQENRRFDVQGPYCTETGSFQLQVSTIVSGTVATVLLISCIVNAFFVFRRRRGRR
ncbi:kremen protein 2-like [Branchiostoma floridae]|uniref:Kremen protein 2-like n=2 Tax=Branchiostoma floridae TaxID=7739 RepID=A0A9J7KJ41_BRAFL|nr:kremen protein 2-like [Branchiostoma floridae]